jgi:hypothetical protein
VLALLWCRSRRDAPALQSLADGYGALPALSVSDVVGHHTLETYRDHVVRQLFRGKRGEAYEEVIYTTFEFGHAAPACRTGHQDNRSRSDAARVFAA